MKTENIISIVVFVVVIFFASISQPTDDAITFEISGLCNEHPKKSCKDIENYCRESLEKGFDCVII